MTSRLQQYWDLLRITLSLRPAFTLLKLYGCGRSERADVDPVYHPTESLVRPGDAAPTPRSSG